MMMKTYSLKKQILLFFFVLLGNASSGQTVVAEPLAGRSVTKEYVLQNLVYPESLLASKQSGDVVVGFHIDAQGKCSDYKICSTFNEEASPVALDLVKKILWKPACEFGKAIESEQEYTVVFNCKSYQRYWKKHERIVVPTSSHELDRSYVIYSRNQVEELAQPYFADGKTNMASYIHSNLKFPEAAKASEIQGVVRLSFVVETNGTVSNILVENSVGGGCDNEAIRLLQGTVWIPAIRNGKYVRSNNIQEITFRIGERNYIDGNSY
jgi:TonB family C-terminal domain